MDNTQVYEILVQLATILTAVIGGVGAVPAVNWLKKLIGASGNGALALTIGFAAVWGVAELLIGGQLAPDVLTLGNLAAVVTAVFAISQAKYGMLTGSE
jgi:hypothetical protein